MDGQGAPQKTHTQEEIMQEVEAKVRWPRRSKGTLSKYRDRASRAKTHLEFNFTGEVQHKNLLQAHKQQKEDQGDCNCVSSLSWTSSSFQSLSFTKKSQTGQTIQMQLVRAK